MSIASDTQGHNGGGLGLYAQRSSSPRPQAIVFDSWPDNPGRLNTAAPFRHPSLFWKLSSSDHEPLSPPHATSSSRKRSRGKVCRRFSLDPGALPAGALAANGNGFSLCLVSTTLAHALLLTSKPENETPHGTALFRSLRMMSDAFSTWTILGVHPGAFVGGLRSKIPGADPPDFSNRPGLRLLFVAGVDKDQIFESGEMPHGRKPPSQQPRTFDHEKSKYLPCTLEILRWLIRCAGAKDGPARIWSLRRAVGSKGVLPRLGDAASLLDSGGVRKAGKAGQEQILYNKMPDLHAYINICGKSQNYPVIEHTIFVSVGRHLSEALSGLLGRRGNPAPVTENDGLRKFTPKGVSLSSPTIYPLNDIRITAPGSPVLFSGMATYNEDDVVCDVVWGSLDRPRDTQKLQRISAHPSGSPLTRQHERHEMRDDVGFQDVRPINLASLPAKLDGKVLSRPTESHFTTPDYRDGQSWAMSEPDGQRGGSRHVSVHVPACGSATPGGVISNV
ncbi:hypothetical protein ACRALDRAFT_209803 [Sodiomyces alcalophilus JCM 7366]|uniref:uncharacterized protein n=1 Tax=Sodiomyces alcalophilus JCM 7366 TaxID=591952 RepID=UPI0039B5B6AE